MMAGALWGKRGRGGGRSLTYLAAEPCSARTESIEVPDAMMILARGERIDCSAGKGRGDISPLTSKAGVSILG